MAGESVSWRTALVQLLLSCCCEKLVAEAQGQFGNPEEGERPPLEAATKQRICKCRCGH
jgi:hypothetical protein